MFSYCDNTVRLLVATAIRVNNSSQLESARWNAYLCHSNSAECRNARQGQVLLTFSEKTKVKPVII